MQDLMLNFKRESMRTKNKISLWAAAIMMMAGVSCKKDFLDRNPLDSPSSGTFWSSESDVQTALAGVYSRLQSNFLGYQRVYLEGLSDNAYTDPRVFSKPPQVNRRKLCCPRNIWRKNRFIGCCYYYPTTLFKHQHN
jgi:hypothetical protein